MVSSVSGKAGFTSVLIDKTASSPGKAYIWKHINHGSQMANFSDSQGLPKRLLSAHHKCDINIPLILSETVL